MGKLSRLNNWRLALLWVSIMCTFIGIEAALYASGIAQTLFSVITYVTISLLFLTILIPYLYIRRREEALRLA